MAATEDVPEIRESKRVRRRPQKYEDKDYNPSGYFSSSTEEDEPDYSSFSRSGGSVGGSRMPEPEPLLPEQVPLLPAAYDELRDVLKSNITDLKRLLHRHGPEDLTELFRTTRRERQTRGKGKEETKVILCLLILTFVATSAVAIFIPVLF